MTPIETLDNPLDWRSEQELAPLSPSFAAKVRAGAVALARDQVFLLVVSGLRTAAAQTALFAQGRSAPGKIVTHARAGLSMHNYGLAADIVPFLSGSGGSLNWHPETPQFLHMAAVLKEQGLAWGGDWHGDLGDFDHFQMAGLPATPSSAMLRAYTDAFLNPTAALPALWRRADQGDFAA